MITSIQIETSAIKQELATCELELSNKQRILREIASDLATTQTSLSLAEESYKRLLANQEELNKLNAEIATNVNNLLCLDFLKDAFGANGIKAIVIDYILPDLEERINNILSKLSDFRVSLETQKSGAGKDVVIEGLFIFIYNELGEQANYDTYSGGERLKIAVAISEALAEIQNFGFRILDELFIGLDEESVEGFVEVINTLQNKFPQLVCVSHLRSIQDAFNEKITIVKNKGNSQIL
jgi:exonuclease SbcC